MGTCKNIDQEYMMRHSYRVAGWKPVVMIGTAGFVTGLMLAGGIGGVFASATLASVDVTNSQPPAPGPKMTSAVLAAVGIPSPQPPTPGPETVVITDPGGGNNGPKTVVISGTGTGDGPGPKAVVISGGDPKDEGLNAAAR